MCTTCFSAKDDAEFCSDHCLCAWPVLVASLTFNFAVTIACVHDLCQCPSWHWIFQWLLLVCITCVSAQADAEFCSDHCLCAWPVLVAKLTLNFACSVSVPEPTFSFAATVVCTHDMFQCLGWQSILQWPLFMCMTCLRAWANIQVCMTCLSGQADIQFCSNCCLCAWPVSEPELTFKFAATVVCVHDKFQCLGWH